MMVMPALTGSLTQQNISSAPQDACAQALANCCRYDAICGGNNGRDGYELYPGACSTRDKELF